ncbi:bromodomain and WD repeat-containing DDB_G0285837 isoform X2 [Hermetia illucens]|uniref:bromodomain and WD repeat-containing DDB_G0285837 isoform X2 n=1 Tax=Hermetia illucens TaxID=343691 RepID=UPI0018CC7268|nr:bromodomain and WD repeat-containing DDB_G0285837 isoform X2 [Hermetia illucens]
MDLNDPPTSHVALDSQNSLSWTSSNPNNGSNNKSSVLSPSQLQQPPQQQQPQQPIFNGKIQRSASNEESDLSVKNTENGKRKKSKSSNASVAPNPPSRKDLDDWLESCLKDAAGPQLSSSSEFLDYNASSFSTNKKSSSQNFNSNNGRSKLPQNSINYYFQKLQAAQELPSYHHHFTNFNKMQSHSHHLPNDPSLEFASLPPLVNYGPNGESNLNDNIDMNDPTRSLRFSDPCLIAPSDTDSKISGKNSPDTKSFENQTTSNKLLTRLLEEINSLHETNSKICRNLHETKGMYTPGAMTDVVREVKEAARVREEALLSRVKAMVEERSWVAAEGSIRMMRDIEELKAQIQHLRSDRKESNKRIAQLETENRYIRSILSSVVNNRTSEIIHENEFVRSTPIRKNVMETPRQKSQRHSLNLNYGTINYEDGFSTMPTNAAPKSVSLDAIKLDQIKSQLDRQNSHSSTLESQQQNGGTFRPENAYHSSSSHDGGAGDGEHLLQIQNDTIDLRRELQDAIASKKQAENRIIALENMVRRLQMKGAAGVVGSPPTSNSTGHHNDTIGIQLNGSLSTPATSEYTQSNTHNLSPSQIQTMSTKLSLAGPITDL